MRNRTSLVLMEQLIMVLVFALAAALCLQVFVRADRISRETGRRDLAVSLAQNAAETLKACRGDLEEAARILQGSKEQEGCMVYYDQTANPVKEGAQWQYRLEIAGMDADKAGLGQARVQVFFHGEEEALFSLTVAWQEVE